MSPRRTHAISPEAARRPRVEALSQTDSEEYSDDDENEMTYQPRGLNFQT